MTVLSQHLHNGIILSLFVLFTGTIILQLYYIIFIFRKLAFYESDHKAEIAEIPVSIIISARNESKALEENLRSVLEQEYPNFEVIVVNNNSIDDSAQILSQFEKEYKQLKIVELNNHKYMREGKKLPLTLGIKAAKYEHLLFTDADCKPKTSQWLKTMTYGFASNQEIILGYGPCYRTKGIINTIIRFDTAWIGINYFSFALSNHPYMGVGRNLAYTKNAYQAVDGFKNHYALASGDDDLFIQEASKKSTLGIQIDPKSYCFSPSKTSWASWINQKSRHYTTSTKYSFIKKLLLAIYPVSLITAWFSFVSLMILGDSAIICLFIMGLFYFIKWWIQGKCLINLNERKFALFFPFWDLFYSVLSPLIYILGKTKQNKNW